MLWKFYMRKTNLFLLSFPFSSFFSRCFSMYSVCVCVPYYFILFHKLRISETKQKVRDEMKDNRNELYYGIFIFIRMSLDEKRLSLVVDYSSIDSIYYLSILHLLSSELCSINHTYLSNYECNKQCQSLFFTETTQ